MSQTGPQLLARPSYRPRPPEQRRASTACSACHARKIRCDMSRVGQPCTKCQADKFDCTVHVRKRRAKRNMHPGRGPNARENGPAEEITAGPRRTIPEHHMLHKFPHYSFFHRFPGSSRMRLASNDQDNGVLLPIPTEDPSTSQPGVSPGGIEAEDLQFLQQKGALDLPPRHLMDELVGDYFRLFHPFFPVVDRPRFLSRYRQYDEDDIPSGRGPSLLLLQAIIFTAFSAASEETIRAVGFSSRKHARNCLYDRVRRLYHFQYESDDIVNIQVLLLMSHYFPSMVEQKHTWLWAHQAITLAQGVGLHRDSGGGPRRKLWARIWWACLIRDRLIALGTRRPMHINSLDCNTPALCAADVEEEGDDEVDAAVKSIFVELTRLCHYMEGVLSLPLASSESLPQQVGFCEEALEKWSSRLCPAACKPNWAAGADGRDSLVTLYSSVLHLIHNTTLIVLRQYDVGDDRLPEGESIKFPPASVRAVAEDSIWLLNGLRSLDMIHVCPTVCVTTTLPPLSIQLQALQSHPRPAQCNVKAGLTDCLSFLKKLGGVHWHAAFYCDFFEMVAARLPVDTRTQTTQDGSSGAATRASQRNDGTGNDGRGRASIIDETPAHIARSDADTAPRQGDPCTSLLTSEAQALPPWIQGPPDMSVASFPADISTSLGLEFGAEGLSVSDIALLGSWLDDYAVFQNLFPSA